MESISLTDMAEEKLTQGRRAHSDRAAHSIHGGHDHELRQTVMALLAGHELAEYDSGHRAARSVPTPPRTELSTSLAAWPRYCRACASR
jgi:hypothetical protein